MEVVVHGGGRLRRLLRSCLFPFLILSLGLGLAFLLVSNWGLKDRQGEMQGEVEEARGKSERLGIQIGRERTKADDAERLLQSCLSEKEALMSPSQSLEQLMEQKTMEVEEALRERDEMWALAEEAEASCSLEKAEVQFRAKGEMEKLNKEIEGRDATIKSLMEKLLLGG